MKLLLCCTKTEPILSKVEYVYGHEIKTKYDCIPDTKKGNKYLKQMGLGEFLNGKIVAECDFEVEEIGSYDYVLGTETLDENNLLERSCLSLKNIIDYLNPEKCSLNNGYAIHIKNLHIFDEPKELTYYDKYKYDASEASYEDEPIPVEKAPQNMMYCYEEGEKKVLISIHPEYLCKILNGEKTVELRKVVLKEMLCNI